MSGENEVRFTLLTQPLLILNFGISGETLIPNPSNHVSPDCSEFTLIPVRHKTITHMKRISFFASLFFLLMVITTSNAQSSWATSKDVNRVANKDLFANEELAATHLKVSSLGRPDRVSMKGVNEVSVRKTQKADRGNVSSVGTPAWVNTKGVSNISNRTRR